MSLNALSPCAEPHPSGHPGSVLYPGKPATQEFRAVPDLQQLLEPEGCPVPQVEEAVSGVVAMQGLFHPAARVWAFLVGNRKDRKRGVGSSQGTP